MDEPNRGGSLTESPGPKERPRYAPFSPGDPMDGREPWEWKPRYEPEALRRIRCDALYLAGLLILVPVAMLALWLEWPRSWLGLSVEKYEPLLKYGMAWLGGLLGGTLFDVKWLYHSVAKGMWHADRKLWRMFTPHISAGLAFAVVALISSGIVRILDGQALQKIPSVVGTSFLVGYFSDSAVAKLSEIAATLFGSTGGKERHKDLGKPETK